MAGVVVDAKHDPALGFCRKLEFDTFPDNPLTLWLPTATIGRLFGNPLRP